jgi:hypothetical protein
MKKMIVFAVLSALISAGLFASGTNDSFLRGRGNGSGSYSAPKSDSGLIEAEFQRLPVQPLSEEEREGLLLMREEEKLARDVYTYLGERWDARSFLNIAESEQEHMDEVRLLLDKYGLSDPVRSDEIGAFTNQRLSSLYKELTERGSVSSSEGFMVGALIEDLDISDLENLIGRTDNEDIRILYHNLNKGSRNHLRAFVRQLEREGLKFSPQYISPAYFDKIVKSNQETGGIITDPDFSF